MKPILGFWLVIGVIVLDTISQFVFIFHLESLGKIVIGIGMLCISFSKAMELKHRVILFLAGVLSVVFHGLTFLGSSFQIGMPWGLVLFASYLGIIGLAALVLGSAVTTQSVYRFLIFASVLIWGALLYGGLSAIGMLGLVALVSVGGALFVVFVISIAQIDTSGGPRDSYGNPLPPPDMFRDIFRRK